MKKYVCITLAALTLLLCSCQAGAFRTFDEPGYIPTHMTALYPEDPENGSVAVLLRRYDESSSSVAVAPSTGAEMTKIYDLTAGTLTYELTAGDGIIAFFELTTYSDGSVNYALKVLDTEKENELHIPYKKTVSEDDEMQTRFIVIYGRCVYYLTKSNLLGRCRVMRYSVDEKELEEYLSFDFTENELTGGSSCTCISEKDGYLTCACADGNRMILRTYDLRTDGLICEKELPYSAAIVYMADRDGQNDVYAVYYMSAQNDERVGVLKDGKLKDVLTLDGDSYLNREEVRIYGGRLYFEVQNTEKENPYDQFRGMICGADDGYVKEYNGCIKLYKQDDEIYSLCFDKSGDCGIMRLYKADER